MLKVMMFIDGTWLYRNTPQLGRIAGSPDYHLDYAKLPDVLMRRVEEQLGVGRLDLVRRIHYGSYPVNVALEDGERAERSLDFLHMLREELHYEVRSFPVQFEGRRIRRQDREPEDEFMPREKCVDIALAADLLFFAVVPGAYDVALVVVGDRDFVPALRRARQLGRRVLVASIRSSCAGVLSEPEDRGQVRDGDVIWLDGLVHELELRYEPQQLRCESPLHRGDPMVWTRYRPRRGQPFFCDECRQAYAEQCRQRIPEQVLREPDPPRPGELLGRVKRMGRGYGFLTDQQGRDFFFAPFSLVGGLVWELIHVGDPVAFLPGEDVEPGRAPQANAVRLRREDGEAEGEVGDGYAGEE